MALVFINPGHSYNGQPDPGACYFGHRECDVAAVLGKALAAELFEYENVTTQVYQQYNDPTLLTKAKYGNKDAQLNAVSKKANSMKANYFVSIHLNASGSSKAKGVEVLYNPESTKGKALAQAVQAELIKPFVKYIFTDRKAKERTDLAVLNQTSMPAILIEVGFISNKDELNYILSHVEVIAQRIAQGIAKVGKFKKKVAEVVEATEEVKPEIKADRYGLLPSNGKYNLYINDSLVLRENKLETCLAYINSISSNKA